MTNAALRGELLDAIELELGAIEARRRSPADPVAGVRELDHELAELQAGDRRAVVARSMISWPPIDARLPRG